MDELAKDIGVRPSLLWLFFTDFPLFKRVFWGPVTAYQYRLMGPGKWEGARKAIFTQLDRMYHPLKTRQVGFFYVLANIHVKCTNTAGAESNLYPSAPARRASTFHRWPPGQAESDPGGGRSCPLLRPCSQPRRLHRASVQASSTNSPNVLKCTRTMS